MYFLSINNNSSNSELIYLCRNKSVKTHLYTSFYLQFYRQA